MISFVGAGPGDVDLITIKGRRLLEEADIIIYAGSLVSKEHLKFAKEDAQLYDSASMTLEEVIEIMKKAEADGKKLVRLHTGDPTIYGAIKEQIDTLKEMGIESEVIPGVSSFTAAAAALNRQFTLPDVSQTVILTRVEGRTPVPEGEKLSSLAKHRASMAIFLSVQNIEKVVDELLQGYEKDTPIAVVYKATWPDQDYIISTLENIATEVKARGINKMAQILVGDFLNDEYERSKLYDPKFTHKFREASE